MKKKILLAGVCAVGAVITLIAQDTDAVLKIVGGEKAAIAVPDFRGTGDAQNYMGAFNETLWNDLAGSGIFKVVSKSLYPLHVPQRPQDFRSAPPPAPLRGGSPTTLPSGGGLWLSDWATPPVSANYLAFGYTAIDNNQIVLFGWLYNVTQADLSNAQVIGKLYFGTPDEAGARKVAHDFATDILGQFGQKSLAGSKIYFVSNRTRAKEIWSMDYDGSNQKAITHYRSICTMPSISPDNSRLAFTAFLHDRAALLIFTLDPLRKTVFLNPDASVNETLDFTPDGKNVVFSSTLGGGPAQLYIANLDGSGLRRLSTSYAIDVEPKINPKTGAEIVFVSGRSGTPQVYRMNMDGADAVRLTTGEGDAVNPSWNPDGEHIAFSWTRGYEPGNYNIFVMDVASRRVEQLTHGTGRNENPSWAPDGRHIVFSSDRSGSNQIWTMLANGTQLQRLTTSGVNEKPVWSK